MRTADPPPNPLYIGLDLGQARDWTALAIAERVQETPARYQIRHLERWHPERYPQVVARVADIVDRLRQVVHVYDGYRHYEAMRARVALVVDRTGVGRAVGDLFQEAELDATLALVTITGGDTASRADGGYRVPKRDLAGTVAVLLQTGRLEIAAELEHAETLRSELKNFRARITLTGHDTYGAGEEWREGKHDDLVLAAAMALWYGETHGSGEIKPVSGELLTALTSWFDS